MELYDSKDLETKIKPMWIKNNTVHYYDWTHDLKKCKEKLFINKIAPYERERWDKDKLKLYK